MLRTVAKIMNKKKLNSKDNHQTITGAFEKILRINYRNWFERYF